MNYFHAPASSNAYFLVIYIKSGYIGMITKTAEGAEGAAKSFRLGGFPPKFGGRISSPQLLSMKNFLRQRKELERGNLNHSDTNGNDIIHKEVNK